ncbi:probable 2-oxoglutarate-dependent dioxygenase ANS, partial [Asparagus officinalis]
DGGGGSDEFSSFLNRSLRVPQLILPDKVLHRETAAPWAPPEVDLGFLDDGALISAARSAGCFQIVNHGIERSLIEEVGVLAGKGFRLPLEKKREVIRTEEGVWGFEEAAEEEEEVLWWSEGGNEDLAGIWSHGYVEFRDKMHRLCGEMEKIANKITAVLLQNNAEVSEPAALSIAGASAISLRKNTQKRARDVGTREGLLKHEVLQMLLRDSVCSHSLCLRVCQGASRFCVYSKSKKGCVYFPVKDEAIIVTFGEQIQISSGGLCKHAIGKPVYQDEGRDSSVSIEFFYSHPPSSRGSSRNIGGPRIVSLAEQIMIAACLAFLCHVMVYILYGT